MKSFNLSEWALAHQQLVLYFIVALMVAGVIAYGNLGQAEDPDFTIKVVVINTQWPGASAEEVESRLGRPLEKVLWEIPGVEYLYVTSSPGGALLIARFEVGTHPDVAVSRVQARLAGRADVLPAGLPPVSVRSRTIDDVPVFAVTLHGGGLDHLALRRIAAQLEESLKSLPAAAETAIIGGRRLTLRVQLNPEQLSALDDRPLDAALIADLRRLAARVRRNGDALIVLAGGAPAPVRSGPSDLTIAVAET